MTTTIHGSTELLVGLERPEGSPVLAEEALPVARPWTPGPALAALLSLAVAVMALGLQQSPTSRVLTTSERAAGPPGT